MDLGDWLRSLRVERYEAAFRENEIDDTVLPNLTAEDLKDSGVGIVGHRRKLLDAIAALRADPKAKTAPAAPTSAAQPLFGYPLAHENDAERAARAALSIQRALADLNRKNAGAGKPELVARIGLETGPAVVDAGGEIYGDVTNIAARVQALAEPGAV